jgi:putative flavoprotein involved in K+ transport
MYDVVVIGGGQAGLAASYHLKQLGLNFLILEAGDQSTGSWPHYYESLKLFSPAQYSALPGLPFPGDPERYPCRDEVVTYLRDYASL